MVTIVTIDGPAGAGKSTSARLLAERLSLPYLDTGSLYRAVAWLCIYFDCDLTDNEVCGAIARDIRAIIPAPSQIIVSCRDIKMRDISEEIRYPAPSAGSSKVAVLPAVRDALLDFQRQFGAENGCVAEGRDTGTVIFPSATVKFWLVAKPEIREKRVRANHGKEVADQIAERDNREATRAIAPMRPADDAHFIDSSTRSVQEVVDLMEAKVRNFAPNPSQTAPK